MLAIALARRLRACPRGHCAAHEAVARVDRARRRERGQSAKLVGATSVGKRAFISTAESLVAADTDSSLDLYERTGSGTTLLTTGTQRRERRLPGELRSRGGGRPDRLLPDGGETGGGRHGRLPGRLPARGHQPQTLLVRARLAATAPMDAYLVGATENGDRVFIATREALVSSDTDSSLDIYQRSGGVVTLISTGPDGGNGAPGAELIDISTTARRSCSRPPSPWSLPIPTPMQDVYERSGGTTTLVSTGPSGGERQPPGALRRRLRGRLTGLLQHGRVAGCRRHRRRAGRVRTLGRDDDDPLDRAVTAATAARAQASWASRTRGRACSSRPLSG